LITMTDDRIERRAADLLPEERATGSADPEAQAAAILAESDEREHEPNAAPDSFLERRSSGQTVVPDAAPASGSTVAPDSPAASEETVVPGSGAATR
jgi:hypothetical protein